MKIILMNSVSLNGMIARKNGQEDWLPKEGWNEFVANVEEAQNFVMGRKTYELVNELYPDYNFDSIRCGSKVIVTKNKQFSAPESYLVANSPEEAVEIIDKKGYKNLLLIGGGELNLSFLKKGLVNEIQVTVTPHLLTNGRPFVGSGDFETKLEFIDSTILNKGRVLLKYEVLNNGD